MSAVSTGASGSVGGVLSTRDAILAARKDKGTMETFETADYDESSGISSPNRYLTDRTTRVRSDDVVTIDINPQLAFAKFAGRIYDAKPSTASVSVSAAAPTTAPNVSADNVVANITPLPTTAPPSAYASSVSATPHITPAFFEAPVDKFNRLKREIDQFQSDLKQIAVAANTAPTSARSSGTIVVSDSGVSELAALLSTELSELNRQLNAAADDPSLRAVLAADGDVLADLALTAQTRNGHATTLNHLIQQIGDVTTQLPPLTTAVTTAPAPSQSTNTSAAAAAASSSLLTALDRRLSALERIVGLPSSAVSAVAKPKGASSSTQPLWSSVTTSYPDIVTGLTTLQKKISLLDNNKLETIQRQVKAVITELETLEQTRVSGIADPIANTATVSSIASSAQKIDELYDSLGRLDSGLAQVPLITSRLMSLRHLHEQSADALTRLHRVEKSAEETSQMLKDDRAALERITKAAVDNIAQIERNMQSVDERVKAVALKLDKK